MAADEVGRSSTRSLLALALAVFAGAASMRCLDASLPALAGNFDRSVGSVGAAVSAYALSYSAFQFLYGPLSNRVGIYRLITWAACLSATAALACAFAPSLNALILLRFVAGGIAAAIGPLSLAWVSRSSSAENRSVTLARMTAAAILGTAAGQVGGGVLSGLLGWPAVFTALALLFAIAGAALILIAHVTPHILNDGQAGITGGLPTHPLALFRRPAVRWVLAAVGAEGFAIYLSLTYVGALLHNRLSILPARAGLIVALYGLGGITFVLFAPQILNRLSVRARAMFGGALMSAGFVSLGLSASEAGAAAALFAIGFGFLMMHNVLQVMAADMAPDALATSLSLFAALAGLSQAIGAAAGGYVFDRAGSATTCLVSALLLIGLGTLLGRSRFT